ncbi:MAG: MFS transporter, partial [Actinomadura sp.]
MGVYTASFSIAQLTGPTLGGFLAEQFSWRWVFWFNVPLGLVCFIWGAIVLRRSTPTGRDNGLDLLGNALVLVSLGGLLLALSEVTRLGWTHPLILAGLVGFAVLLPLFILWELRIRHPVVDLRLFRDLAFALGTLASLLNSVARIGVVFLVALFFQAVHGESAVEAGLKVLPLPIAAMFASVASGFLQRRLSAAALALVGTALNTTGLGVLCVVISPTVTTWPITVALVLVGLGTGVFLPSNTTMLLHGVPSNRVGIVNAMRLMLQNTGILVGTALTLSIITAPLPVALHDQVFAGTLSHVSGTAVTQLITGYQWALGCMAGVAALATLACFYRRRANPPV